MENTENNNEQSIGDSTINSALAQDSMVPSIYNRVSVLENSRRNVLLCALCLICLVCIDYYTSVLGWKGTHFSGKYFVIWLLVNTVRIIIWGGMIVSLIYMLIIRVSLNHFKSKIARGEVDTKLSPRWVKKPMDGYRISKIIALFFMSIVAIAGLLFFVLVLFFACASC